MAKHDKTTLMGRGDPGFPVTSWTLILNAGDQKKDRERLYELYFRPLYCFHRRHWGSSNEDAKDATQDFLVWIVLNDKFTSQVDRSKCRQFRSYLITSFRNHVNGKLRKKRECLLDEEMMDPGEFPVPGEDTATRIFDREWAQAILNRVLQEVEAGCHRDGLKTHWCVFRDRVMTPILDGAVAPSIPEMRSKYGISPDENVSNMIVRVKRRFGAALSQCLGDYAESPAQLHELLNDFFSVFSQE